MKWDGIFINSIGTCLPRRVPIESIDGITAIGAKHAGYESVTISDMPAHVMAGIAAKQAIDNSDHRTEKLTTIVRSDRTRSRRKNIVERPKFERGARVRHNAFSSRTRSLERWDVLW